MADVACEEYASTLKDLTFNSKPHISMLTMLAEENQQYAPKIVQAIEAHLHKVRPETKLPAIYLIDSIVKNVGGAYLGLFTQNLVSSFCSVFEKVDERTRIQLFKLRQTWSDVFPLKKLNAIDLRVREMDPAWPMAPQSSIHVNPKFLKTTVEDNMQKNNQEIQEAEMRKQLIAKQQELLKLQQQKLELELLQTKAKLEEQKKLLHPPSESQPTSQSATTTPFQAAEDQPHGRKITSEPPLARRPLHEPPKQHVPAPVKSAIVMPHSSAMPVSTTARPQSVVVPMKDPRLMRDPRLSRDPRSSSFHAALVPVNAGPTPAVPVINKRNNDKMVDKTHVNLSVPSNHASRSGANEQSVPNVFNNRETVKSAVVFQPPRSSSDKKNEPSVKIDKTPTTPKKKIDNETKRSSPKSDSKVVKSSPVKEGPKKETKKKTDSPSPKKPAVHIKKDDLLKIPKVVDKPKIAEKNKMPRLEGKAGVEPLKERRGSGRNFKGSSARIEHEYKNVDYSVGKGGFRPRRNYRTNRNRDATPDAKLSGRPAKVADKDAGGSVPEKERSGVRARSRSPIRTSRNTVRDDKKAERIGGEKGEKKKKIRKETESDTSRVAVKDTQKIIVKDLSIDVDLRAINSPKHADKSVNSDTDAKENVHTSSAADEPPSKKMRQEEEAQLDTLFGSKDQDYRQMPPNSEQGVPQLESPRNPSWAKYKAEHPDEFKCSTPRPLKENAQREPYGFTSFDQDFRTGHRDDEYYPQDAEIKPKLPSFHRGRFRRGFSSDGPRIRGFGRGRGRYPGRHIDDPRVLQRHPVYQRLYSREENAEDPNLDIPHALLLSKQAEILKQADQQLKSGHLTREQHQELLNQLGKLYELQTLRQKQKEEELREKIFSQNQRRDYPPFGRDRPPFAGAPRFPYDGPGKRFSGGSETGPGMPPQHGKFNRRQHGGRMFNRQNEVLHSVTEELEQVQRSCKSGDSGKMDVGREMVKEEEMPLELRPVDAVSNSHVRNIAIDGKQMRLLFFGSVAVVLSLGEPPREITFKGNLREIYVDGYTIPLGFGGDTVFADIEGKSHSFKFGVPTKEIYIDDVPYVMQFGGMPKRIMLAGKPRMLRLSGPPPDVEFIPLREGLQDEVLRIIQFEAGGSLKESEASVKNKDAPGKDLAQEGQLDERIKVKVESVDPSSSSVDLEPKKQDVATERNDVKDSKKDDTEKTAVIDNTREIHDTDSRSSLGIPVKPEDENRDVDLRIPEPHEAIPRQPAVTHMQSPIPPMPIPPAVADSDQGGRRASPARFVDSPSRSPVYRGSYQNAPHPDYHEFRAVHSEEGDKDYRDIRTFRQVDPMVFKEEPVDVKYRPQEQPRENVWRDPWRENTNRYLDAPTNRELPQGGGYNPHEPMPPRDEYVPEYWPPQRREEEFQRNQNFFHDRRGRQNSPQRGPPDYPAYRDNGPPTHMMSDSGIRMDFQMYRPNTMPNRMDNLRPPYEPLRPPFEAPSGMPFEMPRPHFENPLRPPIGERGPIVQPAPNFYPSGPTALQRPPFPDQRAELMPPIPERPGFAPLSSVLPAGTPVNQGGLPSVPPPFVLPPQLDVAELFQKLVTAGIISKSTSAAATQENAPEAEKEKSEEREEEEEKIPHIEFTSESLRGHYSGVISKLYRGIQCSSCGLRFTSEQTEKYALHLDWHFRQNRRERDGAKKAVSRKWYYDVQDWIQYEEIEDMEDRARSLFEVQTNEEVIEHIDDLHTVPVGENDEDNTCVVCGEPFEQFWDQEKEEWHLRDSLRVENKTYHPGCYADMKNVTMEPTSDLVVIEKPVRVSWQDKPEKKAAEEKKTDALAEKKEEPAVEMIKIKQEKMDVTDAEEPVKLSVPENEVKIKEEPGEPALPEVPVTAPITGELALPEVSAPAPITGELALPEVPATAPAPVTGELPSLESALVVPIEPSPEAALASPLPNVPSGDSLAPSDEPALVPPAKSTEMPADESPVAVPGESVVEPEIVLPSDSAVETTVQITSGGVAPADSEQMVAQPSQSQVTPETLETSDSVLPVEPPVDEMEQLQVKVEPQETESLPAKGETPTRDEVESRDANQSLETDQMDTSQPAESNERTLSLPTGIKIKQEPMDHEETATVVSELSTADRTIMPEVIVQKPPSPVGETIEKLLESSGEIEREVSSVEVEAIPIPGFTVFPPVMRGTELSGLCSIM